MTDTYRLSMNCRIYLNSASRSAEEQRVPPCVRVNLVEESCRYPTKGFDTVLLAAVAAYAT
jgi:hypothetical protein